ncbi:AraC family transcriptional regulator [Pseudonocardia xinjiangensis]|uniref:AraC family transcriptional regulator n=2 Tax=Pseudonocardia xinjiangensis TaxID=75289 RepID=A0ABX1RB23_9PSEU|nr:AraC family transcriptional regulator [Pseudonocardia xinjiangensis]
MDMITAAISSVRVGRANGRRIAEGSAHGVRFPRTPVLGFHVMLAGEGWLVTEEAEPVAVRPGDVVFTAAGAAHGISRTPCALAELPEVVMADVPPPPVPVDFEFLCGTYPLEHGKVPGFLRHLPSVLAFTPDYERHPELRVVVEMLRADYTTPGPGTDASRAALIDLMIVHILRHLQEQTSPSDWPLTTEPGIADALREIHGRPERQWSVQQLSDVAGMSRTAFTRRFTAAVGTPPMTYLIGWRLSSAARLLRQSDAPLAAIARKVGYSTEFAFAAAFRRRYSVAPGRYRAADTAPAHR